MALKVSKAGASKSLEILEKTVTTSAGARLWESGYRGKREKNSQGSTPDSHLLPLDCREPRGKADVVESRLKPLTFDGGDMPSTAGVERRSYCFLTDGVRSDIGTIVTEAQHVHGSTVLGHRCQARHVLWSLVAVEGVEESAVQYGLKPAPQTLQRERVSKGELHLETTVVGFRS